MNILLITQARMSSTRLPGKVTKALGNSTVLGMHLERLKSVKSVSHFLVATTQEAGSEMIIEISQAHGFDFYLGSLEDVLDRFYQAALKYSPDVIVRVTSDCPLIDPELVADLISQFIANNVDYASNCLIPSLPDGMDCEVFKFSALKRAWEEASLLSEREHVTPYIWKNLDIKGGDKFKGLAVTYKPNLADIRLTLDQEEDYFVLKEIVSKCGPKAPLKEILHFLENHPEIREVNSKIKMNEGYLKSLEKDKK